MLGGGEKNHVCKLIMRDFLDVCTMSLQPLRWQEFNITLKNGSEISEELYNVRKVKLKIFNVKVCSVTFITEYLLYE